MIGKRVYVYYNLNKHIWSVRCCKTKRVICYTDNIILKDIKYKVSEAGRQRVLREKQKNVHAGIEGTVISINEVKIKPSYKEITYNPYKYDSFVYKLKDSNKAIELNRIIHMSNKRVFEQIVQ